MDAVRDAPEGEALDVCNLSGELLYDAGDQSAELSESSEATTIGVSRRTSLTQWCQKIFSVYR